MFLKGMRTFPFPINWKSFSRHHCISWFYPIYRMPFKYRDSVMSRWLSVCQGGCLYVFLLQVNVHAVLSSLCGDQKLGL